MTPLEKFRERVKIAKAGGVKVDGSMPYIVMTADEGEELLAFVSPPGVHDVEKFYRDSA
jgi:hypothetical protein